MLHITTGKRQSHFVFCQTDMQAKIHLLADLGDPLLATQVLEPPIMSTVKPILDSSSVMMPMLVCRDVAAAIDFCKTAFGGVELGCRPGPDGTVAHALLTISGAMIIIEAEWPTLASRAPQADGSSPVVIFVYVEDVDKVVERAVAAGTKVVL